MYLIISLNIIKEIIIIGQGIAGCLLAMDLVSMGLKVTIYHAPPKQASSLHAGGMLHAYNHGYGRIDARYAFFLHHAVKCYSLLAEQLEDELIFEKQLITGFEKKAGSASSNFIRPAGNDLKQLIHPFFNGVENAGTCQPVYWIDVRAMLGGMRQKLKQQSIYREETFRPEGVSFNNGRVSYEDISADHLIFCDGAFGAHQPFFKLPYNFNRGEYLTLKLVDELPRYLYENKYRLVHKGGNDYWFGASNSWNANSNGTFIKEALQVLHRWLKVPFEVTGLFSIERPTTPGQFPYIGLHPENASIGILNGLGSRGLLFAPFYAKQLSELLTGMRSEIDHYDSKRFSKLIAKN